MTRRQLSSFLDGISAYGEQRFLLARNGKVQGFVKESEIPNIEKNFSVPGARLFFEYPFSHIDNFTDDEMIAFTQRSYEEWGKYGLNGDLICLFVERVGEKRQMRVATIYQLMPNKPTLAADVVPILYDSFGNAFVALGTRKWGEQAGSIAIIGGMEEVDGYCFQTPLATIKMEAKQECGIVINPKEHDNKIFYHVPMLPSVDVIVDFCAEQVKQVSGKMHYLGTYETSDAEKRPHLGLKRVNWTTAYALIVHFESELTEEYVASLFMAGDDNAGMQYRRIFHDIYQDKPKFGIEHHLEIFHEACRCFGKNN